MTSPNTNPPNIQWFCFDDEHLKLLTDRLAKRILDSLPSKEPEFIPPSRVMEILDIGKTKLNELKQSGELEFYQEREGSTIAQLVAITIIQ